MGHHRFPNAVHVRWRDDDSPPVGSDYKVMVMDGALTLRFALHRVPHRPLRPSRTRLYQNPPDMRDVVHPVHLSRWLVAKQLGEGCVAGIIVMAEAKGRVALIPIAERERCAVTEDTFPTVGFDLTCAGDLGMT